MAQVDKMNQEIYDIQKDLIQSAQNSKFAENQYIFSKRNSDKCRITMSELAKLKENERVFKPIGKMFVLKEKKQMMTELEQQRTTYETQAEDFQKNQSHYAKKMKEYEKQLLELINVQKKSENN